MKIIPVLLLTVGIATPANAVPIAVAQHEGITITLTDEVCALDAVTNLPRRATWNEGGKTFEGCYGLMGGGIVVSYFEDRTVAAIPAQHFVRVSAL